MGSWRELAAERVGDAAVGSTPPLFHGLTGDLERNLRSLEHLRPPRGVDRGAWTRVVHDAVGLARGGWAQAALALGWSDLDLFGIGPNDSWEFSGLAVWLRGRTMTALDERMAMVREGDARAIFRRRGWGHGKDVGFGEPVPLWSWRRG